MLVAIVVGLALLSGAWLWLRDSSLVAVRRVAVAGVSGPDAREIRSALIVAARGMTTLDVQMSHLRTAVAPYPDVKDLQVSTQFPHGMRIRVVEQVPVAVIVAPGRRLAVAGDGTVLHDSAQTSSLPAIAMGVAPGGSRVTGTTLSEVGMLAAAPYELLAKVSQVSSDPTRGLVAQLRAGPAIYFGAADRLRDKWTAAIGVLGAASSAGATYVDVTDPARPAAGPGSATAAAPGSATAATPTATPGQATTTTLGGGG